MEEILEIDNLIILIVDFSSDPSLLPIENATLVKRNPIIDYNDDVNPVEANAMQIRNLQHSSLSSAAASIHHEHFADDRGALSNEENG